MIAANIPALSAAIVLIIGAIASGIVIIIRQAQNRSEIRAIPPQLNRIEVLVDGRYSEVLQELADVKLLLAKSSGDPHDMVKAIEGQNRSNEQAKRVKDAQAASTPNIPK